MLDRLFLSLFVCCCHWWTRCTSMSVWSFDFEFSSWHRFSYHRLFCNDLLDIRKASSTRLSLEDLISSLRTWWWSLCFDSSLLLSHIWSVSDPAIIDVLLIRILRTLHLSVKWRTSLGLRLVSGTYVLNGGTCVEPRSPPSEPSSHVSSPWSFPLLILFMILRHLYLLL